MAAPTILQPDGVLNLALAVVASSSTPLLLLDGKLTVLAASASFFTAFQLDPSAALGRSMFELGDGEWDIRQLRSLLHATASGDAAIDAYEVDLARPGMATRRLVLNAQKLDYVDGGEADTRLLVALSDVTDARAAAKLKDDLLREKAILLQEIQHRVANSLQIIASVLLQSARRINSEEARGHLHDAHSRVMSVAALQQQLANSTLGEVKLRSYFTQLAESLGASMIRDREQLRLEVVCDESVVDAATSASLGLIVTELVINALKHAFPTGRPGTITIDYQARGSNWTLSVADDGIGIPSGPDLAKAGLGTSIVEALAKQLHARVHVGPGHPGTLVSVDHAQLSLVQDDEQAAV